MNELGKVDNFIYHNFKDKWPFWKALLFIILLNGVLIFFSYYDWWQSVRWLVGILLYYLFNKIFLLRGVNPIISFVLSLSLVFFTLPMMLVLWLVKDNFLTSKK